MAERIKNKMCFLRQNTSTVPHSAVKISKLALPSARIVSLFFWLDNLLHLGVANKYTVALCHAVYIEYHGHTVTEPQYRQLNYGSRAMLHD